MGRNSASRVYSRILHPVFDQTYKRCRQHWSPVPIHRWLFPLWRTYTESRYTMHFNGNTIWWIVEKIRKNNSFNAKRMFNLSQFLVKVSANFFSCGRCMSTGHARDSVKLINCGHISCRLCLIGAITSTETGSVQCFHNDCEAPVSMEEIRALFQWKLHLYVYENQKQMKNNVARFLNFIFATSLVGHQNKRYQHHWNVNDSH